jgi:SnoaL-like protein
MSGDHEGRDGFNKFVAKLGVRGVTATRELHDALANDEHGIELITVHGERSGGRHTWRGVAVLHVRDGKIAETWIHVNDQGALDEFFSRAPLLQTV